MYGANPMFLQPPAGFNPMFFQPPAEANPMYIQPPAGANPMFLQPPAGANPMFLQPPAGANPMFLQPPGTCSCHSLENKKTPPGDLIDTMEHKCHPGCTLKLAFYPAYVKNEFTCVACGGDIKDNSVYGCLTCDLKLHVKCALLPESLSNEGHSTPLTLYYSVESACGKEKSLICGICGLTTPQNLWVYYCQKCGYGTDVSCILTKERLKEDLQSYKDALKPYESCPGSTENFSQKC